MTHRITARPARGEGAAPQVDGSADTVARFIEDAAHSPGGHAAGVAFPRTEADVAALVRANRAVLPVGAQSSLTGGATPAGDLVLSFARMNRVLDIGPDRARVEPGLTLASLQQALDPHGLYYPPVPTFTGASIGGTIATNAAGAATFKYGSTRAWVEALTVVLASGEALDLVRGRVAAHRDGYFEIALQGGVVRVPVPGYRMPDVAKRSAGYHAEPGMDLVDLFVGSEGTLGVATEATLRIVPRASASCTAYVPVASEAEAFRLTAALRDAARLAWTSGGREAWTSRPSSTSTAGRSRWCPIGCSPRRPAAWRRAPGGAARPAGTAAGHDRQPGFPADCRGRRAGRVAARPVLRAAGAVQPPDAAGSRFLATPRAVRFDEVREAVPSTSTNWWGSPGGRSIRGWRRSPAT
jgi:FAD/FMN-containing dehydrogenase